MAVSSQNIGKIAVQLIISATVSVYNNQGRPAFRPGAQYTASPGTYQISTEAGFTPNLNFVAGHSGNDGDGVSRPFATVSCSLNTSIT